MLETLGSSFLLVAVSEMGDKTQLLSFVLAARYRKPIPVLSGILVATLANHALAAGAGTWISTHVPARTLAYILGGLFVAFGIWTLKPDTLEDVKEDSRFGPFLTTATLFFIAEMGDKTQFATAALGARFGNLFLVTLGTTLGMMVTDGMAVFFGDRLAGRVQMKPIRWIAAGLFFLFGIASLWGAVTS